MAKRTVQPAGEGGTEFTLIPDQTQLVGKLASVKTEVMKYGSGEPVIDKKTGEVVEKMEWTFTTSYDDQDRKVWGKTSTAFSAHPDCKLWTWAQELLGFDLPVDFELDDDDLIGLEALLTIGVRSYTTKTGEEKFVNFVEDVARTVENRVPLFTPSAAPAPAGLYDEDDGDPF